MIFIPRWLVRLGAVLLVIQLTGCGGGGGDTSNNSGGGGQVGTGTATLSWTPPSANEDGSTPVNLNGFNVYLGNSQASLQPVANVSANATSYTVNSLPSGVFYFAITAVSTSGMESVYSNVATKTIN